METPYQPTSPAVDQGALAEIQGMKPWLRFISILGFVGSGICLLGALALIGLAAFVPNKPPVLMAGLSILYFFIAVLYLFPSLRLHHAANAAGAVLTNPSSEALTEFLGHHRKLWKLIGIFSIATIILYFVVIIAAIALPILQKLQRS